MNNILDVCLYFGVRKVNINLEIGLLCKDYVRLQGTMLKIILIKTGLTS